MRTAVRRALYAGLSARWPVGGVNKNNRQILEENVLTLRAVLFLSEE